MPNEICIENLSKNVDASTLTNLFRKEGRIISCSIDVDKHFVSLGKGYISFDNPSSAQHAIKTMNNYVLQGNKIKLTLERSDIEADIKAIKERYTKIFIKNIHPEWDDFDLLSEFEQFGHIHESQISVNDGKSNGFGFVIFKEHSSAKAAVESKHRNLVVKPYIPKAIREEKPLSPDAAREILKKSIQFNNLHIKNIPKDMKEDGLQKLFEKFGQINSIKIARDDLQRSKGFGFVCFDSQTDAEKARLEMNGYSLGSNNTLVVNFNQKKGARQNYLALKNLESDARSPEPPTATAKNTFQSKKNILFSFSTK